MYLHIVQSLLHQIHFALGTIEQLLSVLDQEDLSKRPIHNKRSLGELVSHLVTIPIADLEISKGASEYEMQLFYRNHTPSEFIQIKEALWQNYQRLSEEYLNMTSEQLLKPRTSYWGVTYTHLEWLMEMVAHIYHHRAQLHIMIHLIGKEIDQLMLE